MPVKLGDIPSLMIEQKQHDKENCYGWNVNNPYLHCTCGATLANEAIFFQLEVCIGLKRSELAKAIAEYIKTHSLLYDGCKGLADAIIQEEHNLIELKGRSE